MNYLNKNVSYYMIIRESKMVRFKFIIVWSSKLYYHIKKLPQPKFKLSGEFLEIILYYYLTSKFIL
jgi:hypothetical protein